MVQRQAVYKRKFKATLSLVFSSFLIFLGAFSLCFGIWFFLKNTSGLRSPLGKMLSSTSNASLTSKIQSLCMTTHINCTNITVHTDGTATIIVNTDEQVILSLQKDLAAQFTSLQLTIGHLTIEGKGFHLLDFRFDKPVISY